MGKQRSITVGDARVRGEAGIVVAMPTRAKSPRECRGVEGSSERERSFFRALRDALEPWRMGATASLASAVELHLERLERDSSADWPAYSAREVKEAIPSWWTHGTNFARDTMRVMFGASAAREPGSKLWRIEPGAAEAWGLPQKTRGLDGRWYGGGER